MKYKKGKILRYRKEWLIENIMGRQFGKITRFIKITNRRKNIFKQCKDIERKIKELETLKN